MLIQKNVNASDRFGVSYTWGVFLNYYNESVYPGKLSQLSWIGSICMSFFFILGPINEWLTNRLGYTRMLIISSILCPLALMLASISNEVWYFDLGNFRNQTFYFSKHRFGNCI
jgi:MFS family permease